MGPLGRVVDVWHLGECHHLRAGLHVVAIEHDAVALGVVVVVEYGIDGAVVFLAFHHLLLAVCEHIATFVSVVAAEFGRLETYGYAKLGGLHGILQCLTGVELSDEEVACSDRHLGRCAKLVGIAGGELHAGTVVALLHRHRWILVWLGRASAHKEARISRSPVVGKRTVVVLVAPDIIFMNRLVFVEEIVFEVVLHHFVNHGREDESHSVLPFPVAILGSNGVGYLPVGEILHRTVGRR